MPSGKRLRTIQSLQKTAPTVTNRQAAMSQGALSSPTGTVSGRSPIDTQRRYQLRRPGPLHSWRTVEASDRYIGYGYRLLSVRVVSVNLAAHADPLLYLDPLIGTLI